MSTQNRRIRRPPSPHRIVRSRPRLFFSGALGIVVTAALAASTSWRPATRLLVGWDVGIALYLTLAFDMMAGSEVHHIRQRAAEQDEGRFAILVLTVAAALASLAAIVAELGTSASSGEGR